MNGASGRMGYRQHLVRSILAIRDQGGVLLGNGERVQVEPLLVGRSEAKLAELARSPRHRRLHHRPRRGTRRPALGDLRRLPGHQGPRRGDPQGHRGGQGDLHREADGREPRRGPRAGRRWPRPPGSRTVSCTTSCTCPACASCGASSTPGFFGRILSVRGEFGYWVFEGDWQPRSGRAGTTAPRTAAASSSRHVPALELRAGEPVRPCRVGLCARGDAHPHPGRRGRPAVRGDRRRRGLRGVRARRRRDRPAQLQLDRAGRPSTSWSSSRWTAPIGSAVAGLFGCRIQPRNATPRPTWNPDLADTHDYAADWMEPSRTTTSSRTGSRPSGSSSSGTWSRTPPHQFDFLAGARGVRLAEAGLASSRLRGPANVDPAASSPSADSESAALRWMRPRGSTRIAAGAALR